MTPSTWIPLAGAVWFLAACAPLKDPWGLAVRRGLSAEAPRPPDSLQADVAVLPREPGIVPFSARVYAKPGQAYRVDFLGFPSWVAASYLWADDRWMWVLHDKKEVREGRGTQLEMEGSPVRVPNVHAVLGFLWGQVLPGFQDRDTLLAPGPHGEIRWIHQGEKWEADLDPSTGLCREVRSATLTLRYGMYKWWSGRIRPGEAEVFLNGSSVLLLQVRSLGEAPNWRKNPFRLAPPASYERHGLVDSASGG